MTSTLAPITRTAFVRCSPEHAFAVFTDQISAWWPLNTHSVFQDDCAGLSFENGRLIERATDGRSNDWGQVLAWEPPSQVSVTWHPGGTAETETVVTVTFRPEDNGTRVDLEHIGWETFGDEAGNSRSGYDSGWVTVFDCFTKSATDA